MREPRRVLFVSQEISPYLADETPIRLFNRRLPQACQEAGIETRTFMPKYGDINERKNQLHEVIRLSGINIIIAESDHPLLLKVASIQSARIQIYFIDNDDYFRKRKGVVCDETGTEHPDNDERCIFFARGTLETVQKMSWFPGIVQCSGWMTALVPLYIRTAYHDTPFFGKSKVVVGLTEERFDIPFGTDFAQKLRFEGVSRDSVAHLYDTEVDYTTLMKLAIDHADAVAIQSPNADPELIAYAREKGIEVWDFSDGDVANCVEAYKQFDNVTI
ncbi:MAG: glycogen/starch synthase [Paludibacteraceae bacterium]|nr:glycogen/starch synthase [Paludibacteraceae bacterium]MBR3648572.1 glycogen/starch synthase [Paludibacteraceae bacterium]